MEKKRVLFIGIGFYDYEESIKHEFEKLNYEVDYFSEVPPNNFGYRFNSRIKNEKKNQSIRASHSEMIANSCGDCYDIVFIIKGEYLSINAIETIKTKNPKAKYILYLWDSIKRIPNIESKFCFFDKVYSFDRLDCFSNDILNFNPLFFRSEYVNTYKVENPICDIYHLGWFHSDRLELIKKVTKFCDSNNVSYKMILFAGYFSYLFQSVFGGELKGNKKYLIFETLSAKKNKKNILLSKTTLDIAHPMQSGLTMRTIELLGMQRKIITTNSDIVNYDFYHSENILVIDRENPILNNDFFESDFYAISDEIVSRYSIQNWLERMITEKEFLMNTI
jgi:hypothetical protein